MKHLLVHLAYRTLDSDPARGPSTGVTLPVKVLDVDGSVLAEDTASPSLPARLALPDATQRAFVRLTWPSGRTEVQRTDLTADTQSEVVFTDHRISRDEWAAWAVPKLNPLSPLARSERDTELGMARFDAVWLRLWRRDGGTWRREALQPIEVRHSDAARQIDLELARANWLLQIGGSNVTWRFVALPGGGRTRVLITPRDSRDPRADELKVVVTGFREQAETLLEFLSRDAMRPVAMLGDVLSSARHFLETKFEDPVAAVAGAYYLLRVDRWEDVPLQWFKNLSVHFPWIPDTAVIHCARLLRAGSATYTDAFNPVTLLRESLTRGWPVYSEGITLLQEAASLLRSSTAALDERCVRQIEALSAARAWAGAATSFYGRAPGTPEVLQWVGKPQAPRRRNIIPALVKTRTTASSFALGLTESVPPRRPRPMTDNRSVNQEPRRPLLPNGPVDSPRAGQPTQARRVNTTDSLPANLQAFLVPARPARLAHVVTTVNDEFLLGDISRLPSP